ncbi:MAG: hypothetical protein QW128_07285 [Thermoprotei archaeon]
MNPVAKAPKDIIINGRIAPEYSGPVKNAMIYFENNMAANIKGM